MSLARSAIVMIALATPLTLVAQGSSSSAAPKRATSTLVGPAQGTVIVVGGGAMGPEIYGRFITAAGGPDALIVDVPTAGGDSVYTQDAPGTRGWKQAGARNVYVLHTTDRKLADSDSFAAILAKAGGVWFEGGRQFHLVDSYAGTKTERGFHDVLARGGVVGGSSAGASILGDFLVRGAPSNNNFIMDDPGYEKGFAFLRGVGIDQHVVARERLADLADSIIPKYPTLLGISEDEGTAWVVQGDTAMIIGRNKAFVYGAKGAHDDGKPFLTLFPGDRYNLAERRVTHRAADDAPFRVAFIDSLFSKFAQPSAGGATVLVARDGEVLVDKSYGIPAQPKYMPTTTVPQFALGELSAVFRSLCAQLPEAPAGRRGSAGAAAPPTAGRGGRGAAANTGTPFQNCVARRISTPVGMHKTTADSSGQVRSNVDELYRLALGLENPRTFTREATPGASNGDSQPVDHGAGWDSDAYRGSSRFSAFALAGGKRGAFLRVPGRHATVIVLTNDDAFDARSAADAVLDRLFSDQRQ
ncbi:MAG TPA: Type 1 glutamine amidotransferase-like domain-containing protein [Gemmatimonadaceae bacterium]|nr:Type 1 glutamine amidotransferase-like domain-containing protein [Gemmatimonadaceae bacterium]